ncbi:MAG: hypothetical protein ACRDNL_05635 [Spirillospora sp.]
MKVRRRGSIATKVAFAAVLSLTACGGHGASHAVTPAAPSRDLTPAEARTLDHAQEVLISRCMRRHGSVYDVVTPPDDGGAREFRYVVDDVAWARRHGFGSRDQARALRAKDADPNQRRLTRLAASERERYRRTLLGVQPGRIRIALPSGVVILATDQGCLAEAQEAPYGDVRAWLSSDVIVKNLAPLIEQRVRQDRRYRAAQSAWAVCMGRSGHPSPSPEVLRSQVLEDGDLTRPHPPERRAELRAAVAEAVCARRTGFGATARHLDRAYGDSARRTYARQHESWRAARLRALSRARTLGIPAGHR